MVDITVEIVDTRNTVEIFVTLWGEMEVVFYGGFNTQVLCTIAGDVEVHLQDLGLRILLGEADGQGGFRNFAIQGLRGVAGQIFDHLLGDGTTTTLYRTGLEVLGASTEDALRVNAGVGPKCFVLCGCLRSLERLRLVDVGN